MTGKPEDDKVVEMSRMLQGDPAVVGRVLCMMIAMMGGGIKFTTAMMDAVTGLGLIISQEDPETWTATVVTIADAKKAAGIPDKKEMN